MKTNKLKEQLRLRMLGQLSDEKTEVDVNNAYDVAVSFTLSFISFLRENYSEDDPNYPYESYKLNSDFWQDSRTGEVVHISKILESYGNTTS
jgi:hypothetical protein